MTNTQIKAFLALYDTGSTAKASKELFITQPALSRIIKSIEDELGYSLFIREKGKRLVPTYEGDRFYTIASEIRKLYEEALEPSVATIRRTYSISSTASLFYSFFPASCLRFRNEHPDVNLIVDELHSTEAYRLLERSQIDMAIVNSHFTNSQIVSYPLMREKVVLLCSPGLFPAGPVSPMQLDKSKAVITEWSPEFQSYFEYWFGRNFETSTLRIKTGCNIQYFSDIPELWAVVPYLSGLHITQNTNLEIHPLTEAPPMRVCYCIYRRNHNLDLDKSMIDCLRSSIPVIDGVELL